ncbi:hypothetical protein ACN4EK_10720 [Pantanalinema rosaneae CENA516]|uniref:hypothetical protein n=1 Tax=Pantanalinema rosaneae TaxID=1620701 RepID=UPI003D6FF907
MPLLKPDLAHTSLPIFDPYIDFAVWVLQQDGTHIYPFIYHPDGFQNLIKAGIQRYEWEEWIIRLLNRYVKPPHSRPSTPEILAQWIEWSKQAPRQELRKPFRSIKHHPNYQSPVVFWKGTFACAQLIRQLWDQYQPPSVDEHLVQKQMYYIDACDRIQSWEKQTTNSRLHGMHSVIAVNYPVMLSWDIRDQVRVYGLPLR